MHFEQRQILQTNREPRASFIVILGSLWFHIKKDPNYELLLATIFTKNGQNELERLPLTYFFKLLYYLDLALTLYLDTLVGDEGGRLGCVQLGHRGSIGVRPAWNQFIFMQETGERDN